ncbi:hypothetical protein ACTG25_23870 [Aeromonas sp. 80P]
MAGQHLQRQLFLAAALQRPGPGLLQAHAGFRVAQLPIQRLRLVQGAEGTGPVALGIERHGLIAEDDGSVIRRQRRVAEQVVQQPPGLGGSIGIDVEPRHVGANDGLAVGLAQLHHALQRLLIVAFGFPRQVQVRIEVAEGHQQAGTLQAGDGGVRYRLFEAKGGLEFGDGRAQLLGAVEGEPVQGVPLRGLLRMAGDGGSELLQQGERLIRRLGVQGEGNLLQAKVEQAQGLLLGAGQPAGPGVVEQGLG